MRKNFLSIFSIGVVSLFGMSNAIAGDLPKNIAWTAYGTTSSGYAQSVGIGQMLKKNYGTDLRILSLIHI